MDGFGPYPQPPLHPQPNADDRRASLDQTLVGDAPNSGIQHSSNGSMPMSMPRGIPPPGPPVMNSARGQLSGFPGARSPPGAKNTSHVPCKFFRQGNCQAGKACPFLHSTEPAGPCKYFQKGNCKYGMNCANEHILADGRRANRPGFNMSARNMPSNNRGPWPLGPDDPNMAPLLAMQQQQEQQRYHAQASIQKFSEQDLFPAPGGPPVNISTFETAFTSHPGSNYGSPPHETDMRLGLSPVQRGLSVLDAPLPASFDSQGISAIARYGPIAQSVPARIPFDSSSPPSSLPRAQGTNGSSILRSLHSSAYPDEARQAAGMSNGFLGSSPPQAQVDESIGRRIMHSERFSARSRLGPANVPMSSSVPINGRAMLANGMLKADEEWDENFAFEEEFVPKALHDDILTPQEQEKSARRLSSSRLGGDLLDEPGSLGRRRSLQALANASSPGGSNSNSLVGSPSGGSRFGALFARQKTDDGLAIGGNAFGHVGSPLRNSSLQMPSASAVEAPKRPRPTSIGSGLSVESSADGWNGRSPPNLSGIGMISQQLQRTRITSRASDSGSDAGSGAASAARPTLSSSGVGMRGGASERMPSTGAVGMGRDRIEEEEVQEGLFDMEEEGIPVPDSKTKRGGLKRLSSGAGWGFGMGNRSAPKVGLGGEGGLERN